MPSFTSTSLKPQAEFMIGDQSEHNVVFRIAAKTGMYVNPVSRHSHEYEVIQSPSSKYRVVAVQDNKTIGKTGIGTVIYLEEK